MELTVEAGQRLCNTAMLLVGVWAAVRVWVNWRETRHGPSRREQSTGPTAFPANGIQSTVSAPAPIIRAASQEAPPLAPDLIAPNLKKPPRPAGGFGTKAETAQG